MQGKRAERSFEPRGRADRQGLQCALERAVAHARGHDQVILERRADEREGVPAALRIRGWRIDQDDIDRLARLETETGWLVEMKCHRAFRNFLPLPEFHIMDCHSMAPGVGNCNPDSRRPSGCPGLSASDGRRTRANAEWLWIDSKFSA